MTTEQRENFIKECNRSAALDDVTADADTLSKSEIVAALIAGGFTKARAWEIADELKQ